MLTVQHTTVACVLLFATVALVALAVRGRPRIRALARLAAPVLAVALVAGAIAGRPAPDRPRRVTPRPAAVIR